MVVLLLIPQIGAGQGAQEVLKLTKTEEHDAYTIYSMLLKQVGGHSPILGIQRETRIFRPADGEPVWPEPSPQQKRTYHPLIEDFKRRNARPFMLQERFDLASYRLLSVQEVEEIGKMYPPVPPPPGTSGPPTVDPTLKGIGMVLFLSAVGFSPDHHRALVYIATWTGGQYYFLVKRHGKWIMDKGYRGSICSWVV